MGAWGFKVFENDSACDFMFHIEKPIEKIALKKKFDDFQYADIRAAAELVIKISNHYRFNDEVIYALTDKLNFIKNDKEWIDSWRGKRGQLFIKRDLNRQIKALRKCVY